MIRAADLDRGRSRAPGVYLPFWYTGRIKRPGKRYVLRAILEDDFAFWLLAVAWPGAWLLQGLGLAALLVSFWCVYEIGYRENDRVAARYEDDPKLSRNFYLLAADYRAGVAPWCWGAASAALGLVCLAAAHGGLEPAYLATSALSWAVFLLVVRGCFALFNASRKPRRVWYFPWLQLARNFAPAVVVPITPLGAALLLANTLARTFGYWVYRGREARDWPQYSAATLRLALVLGFGLVIACFVSWPDAGGYPQAAAIALWCGYRAARDYKKKARG